MRKGFNIMENKPVSFDDYLKEQVDLVRGSYYPVRAGLLRRLLVRRTRIRNLHPNPEDEFCHPDVGPNYRIISHYEEEFRRKASGHHSSSLSEYEDGGSSDEPLMVEKSRPDGYLILNGHHRWAAGWRMGLPKMEIKIVNLTQEKDLRDMLARSTSDKRATLDLDEVVFRGDDDPLTEKPLPFFLRRLYPERVRLGIPALLNFLEHEGYDIWVYTSRYYSVEHIRTLFRLWSVRLTGIVTGSARKSSRWTHSRTEMKKLAENKYSVTLHIDNDLIVRTHRGSKEMEEASLNASSETWAGDAIEAIKKFS